jgi:predicted transposase/invertase (TIGR01784 family)
LCKDQELHIIELPRFTLTAEQITTPLERWCYFLKHGDTLDTDSLPPTLDVPPIRQAVEILTMLSKDELERERYLDRLKAQRDAQSLANAERLALEEGRRQGHETGHEKGVEQGKLIGRIQLLENILGQPQTAEDELRRQSVAELARLAEILQAKLPKPNGKEQSPGEESRPGAS